MNKSIIIDTGPLVAFLNKSDKDHVWVKTMLSQMVPPLLTCESVLSETCFLPRSTPKGSQKVFELVHRSLLTLPFTLSQETSAITHLLDKYHNIPISLADACLVRMSELYLRASIFTLDRDFKVYRRRGREVIPTLMPEY